MHGGALACQIEIGEGLVEHQQFWIVHERLRDGDPLAQSARKLGQAVVCFVLQADEVHGLAGLVSECFGDGMDAEFGSRQAKEHRLFRGDIRFDVGSVALRHIADAAVCGTCRLTEHPDAAVRGRNQPQFGLHHRGFAGPVGADDCGYRALRNAERAMLPDDATASFDAGVVEFDAGRCLVVHGFSLV